MSRETTISAWCDYSTQVAKHPAEFSLLTDSTDKVSGAQVDACKKHLEHMISVLLDTDTHYVKVQAIANNAAAPVKTKLVTGEDYPCAACSRTFDTSQGRALHYRRIHERKAS